MNKYKAILLVLILPITLLCLMSPPAHAFNIFNDACKGSEAAKSPTCQQAATQTQNNNNPAIDTINTAANILALVTGIAAVVMIIISGFKFVTAGGATPGQRAGDPNAVKSARATLTASIIGLVVVALAWTITRFITDRLIQ
jgi:hypothetical protein